MNLYEQKKEQSPNIFSNDLVSWFWDIKVDEICKKRHCERNSAGFPLSFSLKISCTWLERWVAFIVDVDKKYTPLICQPFLAIK